MFLHRKSAPQFGPLQNNRFCPKVGLAKAQGDPASSNGLHRPGSEYTLHRRIFFAFWQHISPVAVYCQAQILEQHAQIEHRPNRDAVNILCACSESYFCSTLRTAAGSQSVPRPMRQHTVGVGQSRYYGSSAVYRCATHHHLVAMLFN